MGTISFRKPLQHTWWPACVGARGFSLIELLVVVSILATLASIGMPLGELARQRNKEEDLRRSLREIRGAIDAYKRLVDEGRIVRTLDGSGYPPRLELLAEGIPDAKSPAGVKIFLLRQIPRDPFGTQAGDPASTWVLRSYASDPADPKPGADVFDVRSKSDATGLNGRPYRQW